MRRLRVAAAAVTAVLAGSSGCATSVAVADSRPAHRTAALDAGQSQTVTSPVRLIGMWRVRDAGEPRGTSVAFGPANRYGAASDVTVLRPCGELFGTWAGDTAGQLVAQLDGFDEPCLRHDQVAWLDQTVAFRSAGARIKLVDRTGRTLAVLRRESRVPARVRPNPRHDAGVTPPRLTPKLRRELAEPRPLPSGQRAATPPDLLGRWRAVGHPSPKSAYVRFTRFDNWQGFDGCNSYGGRYAVGPGGRLLSTDGPNGLVGCSNNPAPDWVDLTLRVARTSSCRLILFGAHGKRLGVLQRTTGQ